MNKCTTCKIALSQMLRAVVFIIMAGVMISGNFKNAFCESADHSEEKAIFRAVCNYLDAEVRRDYAAVYLCFAPSSSYVLTHDYKQYLAQVKASPEHLVEYRILRISYIQKPEDPKAHPSVEKIAEIEVDVTLLNSNTQQRTEANIGFIFFKEKGKWYKS